MDRQFATLKRTIAANVRLARKALGISQEELAFRAEIDRTYVSQIERGIGNPSLLILHKIGKALDRPVHLLLAKGR